MMIGAGVSRWTMLHLGTAVAALLVALTLLATGYADPVNGLGQPATLIMVHLTTIGWLSLMMFGALYQFIPVMTSTQLYSQRLPLVSFIAIVAGLLAMIAGFLGLDGVALTSAIYLPLGGVLVLAGFTLGVANLAMTLWGARPLLLPARFVAAGLGFLLVTALIGLAFALALTLSNPSAFLLNLDAGGLMLHVLGGLGGWVTLTAMGVSYRLLSMFMLAPEAPRWTSHAAFFATAGGIFIFITAGLIDSGAGISAGLFTSFGAFLALLGAAFYLADIRHLYRVRVRRQLELNSIAAAAALALFACVIAGAAMAAAFGVLARFIPALSYLFIFGWLSGLGLSQLYKIVPFMTWLDVFGKRLGKGPVPRVQDLVNERRAAPWFFLYFGAVIVATGAFAAQSTMFLRLAVGAQLIATAFIAIELWRAHRPDPNATPKPLGKSGPRPVTIPVPLPATQPTENKP